MINNILQQNNDLHLLKDMQYTAYVKYYQEISQAVHKKNYIVHILLISMFSNPQSNHVHCKDVTKNPFNFAKPKKNKRYFIDFVNECGAGS